MKETGEIVVDLSAGRDTVTEKRLATEIKTGPANGCLSLAGNAHTVNLTLTLRNRTKISHARLALWEEDTCSKTHKKQCQFTDNKLYTSSGVTSVIKARAQTAPICVINLQGER